MRFSGVSVYHTVLYLSMNIYEIVAILCRLYKQLVKVYDTSISKSSDKNILGLC